MRALPKTRPWIYTEIMITISIWNNNTERPSSLFLFSDNTKEVNIGRSGRNEIVLMKPNVSMWHARLVIDNDKFIFLDTDSVNGVLVYRSNEVKELQRARVHPKILFAIDDFFFLINRVSSQNIDSEYNLSQIIRRGPLSDNEYIEFSEKHPKSRALELGTPVIPVLGKFHIITQLFDLARRIGLWDSMPAPTLGSLRNLINKIFPTDSTLDSFLIDYFQGIMKNISSSMERTQKINLLFQYAESNEIHMKLCKYFPSEMSKHFTILEFEKK